MKVKDLYWAARNSTFFINLESEGRPLLCGPTADTCRRRRNE